MERGQDIDLFFFVFTVTKSTGQDQNSKKFYAVIRIKKTDLKWNFTFFNLKFFLIERNFFNLKS